MNRWNILLICLSTVALTGVAMLSAEEGGTGACLPVGKVPPVNVAESSPAPPDVAASMRNLWRSAIEPPSGKEDTAALSEAVRRLEEIRMPIRPGTETPAPVGPSPKATSRPSVQPSTQTVRITPVRSLAKLKKLSPDSVTDPLALADALFRGGYLETAAPFYKKAAQLETDEEGKAWMLLQAANCLRKADPAAAAKAYAELMNAYPKSIWSSLAKVQKNLIDWRKTNDLDALLKEAEKRNKEAAGTKPKKTEKTKPNPGKKTND